MILALSLIVGCYVILRCFEIIGNKAEKKKGYEIFIIILATLVILITAFCLYDILSASLEMNKATNNADIELQNLLKNLEI